MSLRQQREIGEFNGDAPVADTGRSEDEDNNKGCVAESRWKEKRVSFGHDGWGWV